MDDRLIGLSVLIFLVRHRIFPIEREFRSSPTIVIGIRMRSNKVEIAEQVNKGSPLNRVIYSMVENK